MEAFSGMRSGGFSPRRQWIAHGEDDLDDLNLFKLGMRALSSGDYGREQA
jgi:hypothetical protein